MAQGTNNKTKAEVIDNIKERYITKTALFGLLQWEVIVSSTKIMSDIVMVTAVNFDKVVINGKIIIK